MQENMTELARKYREEMLRMYGGSRQAVPPPPAPMQPEMPAPMEEPTPIPMSMEEELTPQEAMEEWENAPRMLDPLDMQVQEALEEEQLSTENPEGTIYEEPVLPEYIRPGAMLPNIPQNLPQTIPSFPSAPAYSEHGRLIVVAVTGNGAFPVEGAHVTVTQRSSTGDQVIYLLRTDDSGETPAVRIDTPPASLSQQPGSIQPYALCDIRIFANGFFRNEAFNVPIFAGVTSRQVFQMIPLPMMMHEDMETIQFTSEAPNL